MDRAKSTRRRGCGVSSAGVSVGGHDRRAKGSALARDKPAMS